MSNAVIDYKLHEFPIQLNHAATDRHHIYSLFIHAKKIGVSDVFIKSDRPVIGRVHGRLVHITNRVLSHHEVELVLEDIYGSSNGKIMVREKPLSLAYPVRTGDYRLRFRVEATAVQYDDQSAISIVARELDSIPRKIDKADMAYSYPHLFPKDGLVLICGETGSGKSTLMAGLVRDMMEDATEDDIASHKHIIEYSSPIEYVYSALQPRSLYCEVNQSAIPDDIPNFADAIRNALRRDPNVIMVGEARDAETIKAALLAAQTGHAVYSTLHANTVGGVFIRLIQSLPIEEAPMILGGLIESIRAIICQELLPSLDGKRTPIREELVFTAEMRKTLMEAALKSISTLPSVGNDLVEKYGITREQSINKRIAEGKLSPRYGLLAKAASLTAENSDE